MLAGCGRGGEKESRRVVAPGSAYAIIIEKTDFGACCGSRIEGHLEGFNTAENQTELFEIKGSDDISLKWEGENSLLITTCNATEIKHRSGIWKKDVSAKLLVTVINLPGRKTTDGIECESVGRIF
jgi:hypothetical protein